jgi:hypothetical protein
MHAHRDFALTGATRFLSFAIAFLILAGPGLAQDLRPPKEDFEAPKEEFSPFVNDYFPTRVLFGDTHLHTSWSGDAGMGGATLGPEEAYRFTMGEEVMSHLGLRAKLHRPLDFVVVADHAENFGLADFIRRSDPLVLKNPTGKRWHDMIKAGKGYDAFIEFIAAIGTGEDPIDDPEMTAAAWERATANAEAYNDPGRFTAFIGFEWTTHPGGNNIHRVVIFRDGKDRADTVVPFSAFDSEDVEDLWAYMKAYEANTRGQILAIPHNGNLSNGIMFDTETFSGGPLTQAYAETRMAFEPIVEMTQAKGSGETHPLLSPDDEFANHEILDVGNITGSVGKTPEMLPNEYARSALMRGLAYEVSLGVNPYKFGMIGSTDNHTGLPTTREDNWFGKAHIVEPSPERVEDVLIQSQVDPSLNLMATDLGASGLAAVWARENTRESIFDAMARKEVYATSGTRMAVRVFGGWDFQADEVERPDFARQGYARGVPMGGDLSAAPAGKAPRFMIRALRDPDNANLDRVQMIKGWLDAAGETHERIYDVAVSDGRKIGPDGRCKTPVGSTVDVADASYTNTIGDPLLTAHWVDPDFDPAQRAFYYVRVIEIPKPRWTAYDAKRFGLDLPDDVVMTVQDRAYTSPIWYTP